MNNIDKYKSKVYVVRGESVMLDKDLASFYSMETKNFNQAYKRKSNQFGNHVFQLKKNEWLEILQELGLPHQGGQLPLVYTEKAAYKMAFVLESKTSLEVADLILEVFLTVKKSGFQPVHVDSKMIQLEKRVNAIEKRIEGHSVVTNHYHGHHNQITHNDTSLINFLLEMKKQMGSDPMAEKMTELIDVIKEGKKENVSAYVKKFNDAMDLLTKTGPAVLVLKTAFNVVKAYFGF